MMRTDPEQVNFVIRDGYVYSENRLIGHVAETGLTIHHDFINVDSHGGFYKPTGDITLNLKLKLKELPHDTSSSHHVEKLKKHFRKIDLTNDA